MSSLLRAAPAPVVACALTLVGLVAWTVTGAAGSPADVHVTRARVLLPSNPDATAAFFDLRNTGGADDELLCVTTPLTDRAMLSRRVVRRGAGSMRMVSSARIAAHGTLRMSAEELDVMLRPAPRRLRAGDRVPFVLHFRESGRVRVAAVAVRPGTAADRAASPRMPGT
ncbi:copper chaperone PCu(A)C [Streptomyces sp. NA02950]|uniref:copper chaperone PCu(A)C n=1 Tax=Streptomyces sp. NA02950 TaxID=2742137 RepID=UPI0015920866|nr:copper chaperone PCu(A)C [Streptomyces sp. NA02950]QKV91536.1 copper chaperone PCu(A)C [Streptomyces sp. NA02950]